MGRSGNEVRSGCEHISTPLEVGQKISDSEEQRKDSHERSVNEEMVRREAVQLTVGVNQPRDGHDTGKFADNRSKSAGNPPGKGGLFRVKGK